MIIELEDKFNASIHLESVQQKIQNIGNSDFQRKLFLIICFGHIIHIFDSCMAMFIYDNPIVLLIYFACYSIGQLSALQKYFQRFQLHCSLLQIAILAILYFVNQQYLVIILCLIKSIVNGYMNQVLQMLRFELVKISVNVGYLITVIFSIMATLCNKFGYSYLRCVCVIEFIVLVLLVKQSVRLPPPIAQCLDGEVDVYLRYIEKCVEDASILNYEEFKNSDQQVSVIQTFQVKVHKPTLRKLLFKLTKFHEQIYKYFASQMLFGFLFYSNMTYLKYFNGNYVDIMMLAIFGASVLVFMYDWTITQECICIASQVLKYIWMGNAEVLLVSSLLWSVFHYNVSTSIRSDYRTLVLGVSLICRHLGGMFLAYSVYEYLNEQMHQFLFIQLVVAQLMLCYFGFQTSLQF